jgi:hypothetical protein
VSRQAVARPAARSNSPRREELLARCRRERNELAVLTSSVAGRLHMRDVTRALRLIRRVLRLFAAR